MGPATLISLLILVVVASVVLKDLARMQSAAKPAPRPEDSPLIPRNVNDPLVQSVASLAHSVGALVGAGAGSGVGAAAGRGAGSAVSSAEVELARGLGAQRVSTEERRENLRGSYEAATAAGGAAGTNFFGAIGSALGSVPALPFGLIGTAGALTRVAGEDTAKLLADATPSRQLYDVPFVGAFFNVSDRLFGGRP